MSKISFEWDVETYDHDPASEDPQSGDVLDHHHEDRLADFGEDLLREAMRMEGKRLVLVRDLDEDFSGRPPRSWAYVNEDATLPDHFEDSGGCATVKVPQKFVNEFRRMRDALRAARVIL